MAHPKSILANLHLDWRIKTDKQSLSQAIKQGPEWTPGIPDESVQLDEATLLRRTRGEVPELIQIAIRIKKTNQFAKVAEQVFQHNGVSEYHLNDELEMPPLSTTDVFNMLTSQHKECQYHNTYVRYFIKYERNQFTVKMQEVVYGNCPGCLRAMPLGMDCSTCIGLQAQYIYAAYDEDEQNNTLFSLNQLSMVYRKWPLDPIRVSVKYLNLKPIYSMNYQSFLDLAPIYARSPAGSNYEVMLHDDLIRAVYRSSQRDIFLLDPFRFMIEVFGILRIRIRVAIRSMLDPMYPQNALPIEHQNQLQSALDREQGDNFLPPGVANPVQVMNVDLEEDLFY